MPDNDKIEQFKTAVHDDIEFINTVYFKQDLEIPKERQDTPLHDQNLPFLPLVISLLKKVTINPNSTHIFDAYGYGDDALCYGVIVSRDENNTPKYKYPAGLAFNKQLFSKLSPEEQTFIIAHEIGHLLECHAAIKDNLNKIMNNKLDVQKFNELCRLQEIEADIAYAKKNPSVAKIIYKSWLSKFSKQQLYILKNTAIGGRTAEPHEAFKTHPSFFDRYHWIKKMVELHQKENTKKMNFQPIFAPEKE